MPDNPSEHADLSSIFEAIISDIAAPQVDTDGALQLLVTSLQYDSFIGKYAIGRISRGNAKRGQAVTLIKRDGETNNGRIEKVFGYR